MRKNELSYKSLKNICNPNNFKFETTDDLDSKDLIYGQDRGIKALEFGLDVEAKGYNLYVEGPSGVGKTMYTKNYVNKAFKYNVPDGYWAFKAHWRTLWFNADYMHFVSGTPYFDNRKKKKYVRCVKNY